MRNAVSYCKETEAMAEPKPMAERSVVGLAIHVAMERTTWKRTIKRDVQKVGKSWRQNQTKEFLEGPVFHIATQGEK